MEDIIKIADYYSLEHQLIKACEEFGECSAALSRYLNNEGNIDNVVEEMADVSIMINQLIYLFNVNDKFVNKAIEKIDRQLERIEVERSKKVE